MDLLNDNKYKVGRKYYEFNDISDLFEKHNKKIIDYGNGYVVETYCNYKSFTYPDTVEKSENETEFSRLSFPEGHFKNQDIKDSVKRSRDAIRDIILLNDDLEFFVTLTFDKNIVDSFSPDVVVKKMKSWLKNMVERKSLKYILVPEYHKSGRIHFHGFFNDVLSLVDSGTRLVDGFEKPVKISNFKKYRIQDSQVRDDVIFNILDFTLGNSTAMHVYGEKGARIGYTMKYVTKDVDNLKIFGKRYWSSRNLLRSPTVKLEVVPYSVYDDLSLKEFTGFDDLKYKFHSNLDNRGVENNEIK